MKKIQKRAITIMLVITSESVRTCFRTILEKENNFDIIADASDPSSAVRLAGEHKPNVLILDDGLVKLNGTNTLSLLIASSPDSKILVVSFYSDSRFVLRMLNAGASGYLLNDCAGKDLVSAITTIMANRTYISPGIAGIEKENESIIQK